MQLTQQQLAALQHRFNDQKNNARQRKRRLGVETDWQLTFDQWLDIWMQSGKLEERGRAAKQYCMSRRGDEGPYAVDNVFIQTVSDNCREGGKRRKLKPKH